MLEHVRPDGLVDSDLMAMSAIRAVRRPKTPQPLQSVESCGTRHKQKVVPRETAVTMDEVDPYPSWLKQGRSHNSKRCDMTAMSTIRAVTHPKAPQSGSISSIVINVTRRSIPFMA